MATSIASSAKSFDCPAHAVTPANEGQCAPGLAVQPVALGAPHGIEGAAQPERAQEQGMGKVGQHAARAPTRTGWGALLNGRNALIFVMVYLVVASVNNLTLVASRVIRWDSTWNRPVLSAVVIVCLA